MCLLLKPVGEEAGEGYFFLPLGFCLGEAVGVPSILSLCMYSVCVALVCAVSVCLHMLVDNQYLASVSYCSTACGGTSV